MDWQEEFGQRRRFVRRDVHLPARVRVGGHDLAATTENISPGGAFLRVKLPENTVDFYASIDLPDGRGVHVQARVRWRRSSPPGVGIEFASFLEDAAELNRSA